MSGTEHKSQFELEMRHSFDAPGGRLALAMHRCTAFATALGLFVLLAADWIHRDVSSTSPTGGVEADDLRLTGLELFEHDKRGLASIALVLYLIALVGAIARPAQKGTSAIAACAGLLATVLLLLVAPQTRTVGYIAYTEHWLPTPILSITLWLGLLGIALNARRVSRH
jgi:hypothetical protein